MALNQHYIGAQYDAFDMCTAVPVHAVFCCKSSAFACRLIPVVISSIYEAALSCNMHLCQIRLQIDIVQDLRQKHLALQLQHALALLGMKPLQSSA